MKGALFQKPFEFKLLVSGESWHQRETVSGVLEIKNHGPDGASLGDVHVFLAYGDLKKVAQKNEGAFNVLASIPVDEPKTLVSQGEVKIPWEFRLDQNCPITDKSKSLYLLYGQGPAGIGLGHLQLKILPVETLLEFLKIFQVEFRFVVKAMKSSKGAVEVKLVPPTARVFASLENLVLHLRFEGEDLKVGYGFNFRKIDVGASSLSLAKSKKEFEQVFTPKEFIRSNGRIDHDRMQKAIEEVLTQLEMVPKF